MIHEKLKTLLKQRGISVRRFAAMLDLESISQATVHRWVSGQQLPRLDEAVAIAQFFNISLDELAGTGVGLSGLSDEETEILGLIRKIGLEESEARLLMKRGATPQELGKKAGG